MREISVDRTIEAPPAAVWKVLADFPNIADWNSGVKLSRSTSDSTGGVGATRHCDLAPVGELEETIAEWDPENKMVVSIDSTAKLPIKHGLVTFSLDEQSDSVTTTSIRYEYEPGYGPIGKMMGPMVDKQLTKGFGGFLEDLDAAAQSRSTS